MAWWRGKRRLQRAQDGWRGGSFVRELFPPMNTRRSFITTSTAAAMSSATHAFAAPSDGEIKIALIGCGGRGTGACNQALTAGSTIKLVALVDPLEGKAQAALDILKEKHEGQIAVPPEQVFTRFEDYKKAFELADVVLITTPPGPRRRTPVSNCG